ncbi:hypothetical protein Acsp04_24630 [Actinomadura sp. NBRC 104425]|uniref:hypothetical protein n=1 Tax=Actinomadura sp. NBRC 104425 TaxID=3032204 RepID=UPI0024A56418|nr:hypothetical protein [Actinomadura sp. NBRC 104425]GLZ12228.1 hypothetical protein Acsp04_24630 [Actinomadura sp. NBRC 104425]
MTTPEIDELVARLAPGYDDRAAEPASPGARALLAAITAEPRAAARPRRRRYGRYAAGLVAATAVAAGAVVALDAGGPGPVRGYANAAVDIRRTDDTYRVHVKDVYADQRQFREAFARLGLDVTLSIVPVSPGRERKIIRLGGASRTGADGTPGSIQIATVLDCPPGRGTACPLTVELSGEAVRWQATEIVIGRTARPGEVYRDQHPAAGDNPPSLRLTGRTVAQALARLRARHMTAAYLIGEFKKDGSGNYYSPPADWRPEGGRHVAGAWMRSSDSVTLLVAPRQGDPGPDPSRPAPF